MADGLPPECSSEAMSRLAAIVDSSDDAILSKDLTGTVLSWNRAAERLYGYTAAEIVGKPINILVPHDRPFEVANILARIARGERVEHFETERVRKDGSVVPVSLTISPIRDANGTVVGASTIARDISERRRADFAVREAMRAAEEANRAKSGFLSRMNHELRTPLNAILGFAQVLEMDDNLTKEQRDSINEILRAGQHLLGLIGDVLDIAKVEGGHLSLSTEEIDLSEVVEETVSLVRPLADERQIDLQVAIVSKMIVTADPQALKQIMLNLLSNAVKYNRAGGVVRTIAAPKDNDRLRISVEDTGMGLSPEKLERLFTPFDRAGAEATTVQGSGLGLSLAKGLAQEMGGDLTVESTPGVGSIFSIELPGRRSDVHVRLEPEGRTASESA